MDPLEVEGSAAAHRRGSPGGLPPGGVVKGALLAALGLVLLVQAATGSVAYYINQSYTWLAVLSGLVLVVMALAQLRPWALGAGPRGPGLFAYAALAVPLVLGLAVPARPLGSAAVANQGVSSRLPVNLRAPAGFQVAFDTSHWTLLDWILAWSRDPDLRTLRGKRVSVIGFVYHDAKDRAPDRFFVARFVITHCAADSTAIALPVQYGGASGLAKDTWVQVDGSMAALGEGRDKGLLIEAERVAPVPRPARPYLYP